MQERLEGRPHASPAWWLAAAATLVALSVSGNLLTWVGDPYVSDGGALVLKIHPASYLAAAAAVARAWETRDPLGTIWRVGWSAPCLAGFLACIAFCTLYAAIMTGCCTLVVFLDTFLPAGLLAFALHGASSKERLWLLRLLQVGLAANAALALIEAVTRSNLVPLYLNGAEYESVASEFRPTAFYDHPLTGAILTMLGLLLPFRLAGWRVLKILYPALLSAGLLAFGGRAAACLALLAIGLRWLPILARAVLSRRYIRPAGLLAGAAASLLLPCLVIAAQASGLGERLLGHLYWDDSAQVRLQQWHIIGLLSTPQIIFGTSRPDLIALLVPLKLQWGVGVIENFWLLMFIDLGLIGFPAFLAGMAALSVWCAREARPAAPYLVLCVMLAASTSNSLARKSNLLVLLVAGVVSAAGASFRRLAAGSTSGPGSRDRPMQAGWLAARPEMAG